MFSVIIVSAGKSQRYRRSIGDIGQKNDGASVSSEVSGNSRNKNLELIGGIPVFIHSLQAFQDECYREIILTVSPQNYENGSYRRVLSQYKEELSNYSSLTSRLQIIPGGAERYLSVGEGLRHCNPNFKWVLIHDAARPLLDPNDLSCIQETIKEHWDEEIGILPVIDTTDTIKQVDRDGWVIGNLPRSALRGASTPQCFPLALLKAAYKKWKDWSRSGKGDVPTDDSEVFFDAGYKILTVPLTRPNPKLTTANDYQLMTRLWEQRSKM